MSKSDDKRIVIRSLPKDLNKIIGHEKGTVIYVTKEVAQDKNIQDFIRECYTREYVIKSIEETYKKR